MQVAHSNFLIAVIHQNDFLVVVCLCRPAIGASWLIVWFCDAPLNQGRFHWGWVVLLFLVGESHKTTCMYAGGILKYLIQRNNVKKKDITSILRVTKTLWEVTAYKVTNSLSHKLSHLLVWLLEKYVVWNYPN